MKKLMIAAAAAAMVGGAFADAQVYDIQAVGVTTTAAWGEIKAGTNPWQTAGGDVLYRIPQTVYFGGAIWGCDCGALAGDFVVTTNENNRIRYDGMVIWNQAGEKVFISDAKDKKGITWSVLNRIGAWAELAEGVGSIYRDISHNPVSQYDNCGGDYYIDITFAGFGTAIGSTACEASVLGYLSGNFAGAVPAPQCTENGSIVCYYCGDEDIPTTCEKSAAWPVCSCLDDATVADQTAVHGQFVIVYNAAYSTALKNAADITLVYPFPTAVKALLEELHDPLIVE